MEGHNLGIEILDTSNENILKLTDISVYSEELDVTCPELLITPPGFQVSASISPSTLVPGFNVVLTACMLDLQTDACDSRLDPLPDGIYALRYSVAPNDAVFVEYNHLRTVKAEKRLTKLLCQVTGEDYFLPEQKKNLLTKVQEVKGMLDAAKASVNFCHNANKGMIIYERALKMIDKIDCKGCS
jgi:hypothetical protein